MLETRGLSLWGQAPPKPRTRDANNPTLLYSWWCTGFAAVIIITRLCGRKTRSDKLFTEDWIMMFALIPLIIRMALIHVVLLYGTNNVQTIGYHYTEEELYQRSIGARLVLAARISYAMFIWMSKLTVSEFLKRITIRIWKRPYELTLRGLRVFLVLTFFAVVVATLTECQPFDHYWQVKPDPGAHCRQGYGNLITMGVCDIVTDILLIAFPIPIILQSGQTWKRKLQLLSLFSLSIILIGVTATRVPKVVEYRGRQQYRTVWASSEILASAAVSNAVILGSFLRDKGTKRNKYRSSSMTDSIDRASVRRPTVTALQDTGSEEDLFRFLGIRVPTHLRDETRIAPRPAPAAPPASTSRAVGTRTSEHQGIKTTHPDASDGSSDSDISLHKQHAPERRAPSPVPSSNQTVSFFDVGGLLEDGSPDTRSRATTLAESRYSGTLAQDFAHPTPTQSRRGSRTFLQDVGGLLTPSTSRASSGMDRYTGRRQSDSHLYPPSRQTRASPTGHLGPMLERLETQNSLQDAGGLLGGIPESQSESIHRALSSFGPDVPLQTLSPMSEHQSGSGATGSFEDVGGLLAEDHEVVANPAALQRATQQHQRVASPSHPRTIPAPHSSQGGGWDSIDLHDPRDLLTK